MSADPETLVRDVLAKLMKSQEGTARQEVAELRSAMTELANALPDLVGAIESTNGADKIAAALRELAGALQRTPEAAPPAEAPTVNVAAPSVTVTPKINVPAAAAPVIHNQIIAAADKGAVFEVRVKGLNGEPDRIMTITRLK